MELGGVYYIGEPESSGTDIWGERILETMFQDSSSWIWLRPASVKNLNLNRTRNLQYNTRFNASGHRDAVTVRSLALTPVIFRIFLSLYPRTRERRKASFLMSTDIYIFP